MNVLAFKDDRLTAFKFQALEIWRPVIEKILVRDGDLQTFDDIYTSVMNNETYIFTNERSFCIVRVNLPSKGAILHVTMAGGKQKDLYDLEHVVRVFGKQIGATKITLLARKGFLKRLGKHGWKQPLAYFEKDI